MKMIHTAKIVLALTFAALTTTGCLDKYPEDAIPDRKAIQTVEDADQAVIGIYSGFKNSALYSGFLTLLPDIQADLVHAVEGYSNTHGEVWRWEILATNRDVESVYGALYQIIGRCNFFFESIAGLEKSLTDDAVIDRLQHLKGEVYFARALCYSELIKCFCKAYEPETADKELGVVLVSSYFNPERMISSSLKASYEFVVGDLQNAAEMISEKEVSNTPYITKSAVHALWARVSLYMQNWADARDYATKVIEDKTLLLSNATQMITEKQNYYQYMWDNDSATEIIWKIGFTGTSYGGALGRVFLNYDYTSFRPDYVPATWALNLYAPSDLRYSAFFALKTTGYAHGLTCPLLIKYYGNQKLLASNILHVSMPKVFRLSEQYLIRAEAQCQLEQYGEGAKDLTTLRLARYKSYGSASLTKDNWLETISQERVRELYMEGFRLQDLKRWHKGFERTAQLHTIPEGGNLKIKADNPLFVWPIPQNELDAPGSEIQPNESNK